jgi:hypothetical protein
MLNSAWPFGAPYEPQTQKAEKQAPRLPNVQASQDEWRGQDVPRSRAKSRNEPKSVETINDSLMVLQSSGAAPSAFEGAGFSGFTLKLSGVDRVF